MATTLITLVIYIVVIGLIFYVLWWGLSQIPLPDPFGTIARVVLVVAAVLIACYLLLQLVPGGGHLRLGLAERPIAALVKTPLGIGPRVGDRA